MLKCLIVDDEAISREGLFEAIDWQSLDIQVVGLAKNGQEGLELFQKEHPDIVISDVRMPIMDGLEMIEEMVKQDNQVKFIVISAYSEFRYAQKAMRFGVNNYLLKPVEDDELFANVAEVAEKKRQVQKQVESEKLQALLEKGNLSLASNEGCLVVIAGKEGQATPELQIVAAGRYNNRHIQIMRLPKVARLTAEKSIDGYASSLLGDGNLKLGYEQASQAAVNGAFWQLSSLSWGKVLRQRQKWMASSVMRNQALENLMERYYSAGESEQAFEQVLANFLRMVSQYQGLDKEDLWRYFYEVFIRLDDRFFVLGSEEQRLQTKDTLSTCENYEELTSTFKRLMYQTVKQKRMDSDHEIIRRIKEIIAKGYGEELSSRKIAEEVFLSPNYMGKLFRDHTGQYLNDYILEVRLKQARKLLLEKNDSIAEIATAVGISSPSYFTSLFKKFFGQTPKELRRKQQINRQNT